MEELTKLKSIIYHRILKNNINLHKKARDRDLGDIEKDKPCDFVQGMGIGDAT